MNILGHIIGAAGQITMPSQPAFFVKPAGESGSTRTDLAINASHTIDFDSEEFDIGGNFTGDTFTAPVTGKYQLNLLLNFSDFDTDFGYIWISFITSNTTIYAQIASGAQQRADGYAAYSGSVLCDMDAGDTAFIRAEISNAGAAQLNVLSSSWYSGFLAC